MINITDNGSPKYRSDIDGLRALAVISVVIYHAFPLSIKGGFIGVDIFFVISGYLISGIVYDGLYKNKFSFINFYTRRIKRIFPALIIVLAFCFVSGWYFTTPEEYQQLGKHILSGAGFVSNFVLWQESNYFDAVAESKPLLHLWSLSIEEQFYLFWPVLLFLFWKRGFKLIQIILPLAVVSFILNVALIHRHSVATFYFPITRFWELLLGSALAYTELHKINLFSITSAFINNNFRKTFPLNQNMKSFLGLGLIICALFGLSKENNFPGWWALLPTLGTVLLISSGPNAWLNRKILSQKNLVWFGLISYPLYLWHWPLLSFERILETGAHNYVFRISAVLISIGLAWLCYKYIEIPIRSSKKDTIKNSLLVSSLLLIIALTGYYINIKGGFPSRLPQILQQITQTTFGDAKVMEEWRRSTCFLERDLEPKHFADSCWDKNRRPLVFLWGDSHAAALYPGLKSLQQKLNFGIAQYTASICPPIMNWNSWYHYYCKEINDANLSLIRKIKPDIVLLHSNWVTAHYDWHRLNLTVAELKKAGVGKIILIGPVPLWSEALPVVIYSYYRKFKQLPPKWTHFGLADDGKDVSEVDKMLQDEAKKLNISYISAFQTLCNQNGCLMRTGENATDLTTFDGGHLSPAGSDTFISLISDKIFGSVSKNNASLNAVEP